MTAGKRTLFFAGQLGLMLLFRQLLTFLYDFAGEVQLGQVLLDVGLVGTVFLAFRIFDGVTDPIAGTLADRWVASGRARRGLLPLTFALAPLGLVLCFLPSHEMAAATRWITLTGGMLLFFIGYTVYGIPYWSLIDDYGQGDEAERERLSNLLGAGMMAATAVGFLVMPAVNEALGFLGAAIALAVAAGALMICPYWASPAGLGAPEPSGAQPGLRAMLATLQHRRFLAVILLIGGSQMSLTMMSAAAGALCVHLLAGSVGDIPLVMGPLIGAALPAFVFVPWLSRRYGWEQALTISAFVLGGLYLLIGFALGAEWFGSPKLTAAVLFGLGGPMIAVLLGLEGEAIARCANERDPGAVSIYFGAYNLIVKAANGLAFAITGGLLSLASQGWGSAAIRALPQVAGASLAVGAIGYLALRPGGEAAQSPAAAASAEGPPS